MRHVRDRMKSIGLLALLMLPGPPTAAASEPWGLKEDKLGMSLADFKATHRRLAAPSQYAPMCSDTSPQGSGIAIDGHALGRVNCRLDYPFERMRRPWEKGYAPPPTIAEIPMLSHVYRFLDGSLWKIEVFVERKDFPALRAATEAKYGPPSRSEMEQVQNKLGATFTGSVLTWQGDGQILELRELAGSVDVSRFAMYRQDLEAEAAARVEKAAQKATSDM